MPSVGRSPSSQHWDQEVQMILREKLLIRGSSDNPPRPAGRWPISMPALTRNPDESLLAEPAQAKQTLRELRQG